MLFFTSSLDRAADALLAARFRVARAERRGYGVEAAQRELAIAEAAWQAVCDGLKSRTKKLTQPRRVEPRMRVVAADIRRDLR